MCGGESGHGEHRADAGASLGFKVTGIKLSSGFVLGRAKGRSMKQSKQTSKTSWRTRKPGSCHFFHYVW